MSERQREEMTSETFAVPGLLLMLAAVALAGLGIATAVVAVPFCLSLALAVWAAHAESVARSSRRQRH
jgi:ABC-type dipeptide/oligopeptide/nickel transport system permease subunit